MTFFGRFKIRRKRIEKSMSSIDFIYMRFNIKYN